VAVKAKGPRLMDKRRRSGHHGHPGQRPGIPSKPGGPPGGPLPPHPGQRGRPPHRGQPPSRYIIEISQYHFCCTKSLETRHAFNFSCGRSWQQ